MSNTFIYEQGWLVEKPEMEKPELDEGVGKTGYYYRSDYIVAKSEYEKHLTTLRRFKYDYPDPGKEMELGKDFHVEKTSVFGNLIYPTAYTEVAIPITQRTYSEQEVDVLKKEYFDAGLMAEMIIANGTIEKLEREVKKLEAKYEWKRCRCNVKHHWCFIHNKWGKALKLNNPL